MLHVIPIIILLIVLFVSEIKFKKDLKELDTELHDIEKEIKKLREQMLDKMSKFKGNGKSM